MAKGRGNRGLASDARPSRGEPASADPGRRSGARPAPDDPDPFDRYRGPEGEEPPPFGDARGRAPLPELLRKALSLGFSGFLVTESAVRRALGDTLPKDWVDFATEQSERARRDFIDRLSFEIGQALERVDVASVLGQLLEGRTLEIRTEIHLGERESREERSRRTAAGESGAPRTQVRVHTREDEDLP